MDKHEHERGDQDKRNPGSGEPEIEQQRRDLEGKKNPQLTKEELPDSTNESIGTMGSGQRQDSN